MGTLLRYILTEHRFLSQATRQLKQVDPRIIVGSIQIAAQRNLDLFKWLWDTYAPDLYTVGDLIDVLKVVNSTNP
jgi:hypothetical protein